MKQRDIKPCSLCGKGLCSNNQIQFFRIRFEQMIVDFNAVRRQAGLEMMMGGHATLAAIMGPDEDMAKSVQPATDILVCQECAITKPIFELCSLDAKKEPSP